MANYVNVNKLNLPIGGNDNTGIFSRIKNAGANMSTTTIMVIIAILVFIGIGIYYYVYYVSPMMAPSYKPNTEKTSDQGSSNKYAEIYMFHASWCPHCKAAKPIWEDVKSKYNNKVINGYTVIMTDIDCTEETAESAEMMDKFNIEGFPTIKMVKNNQIVEFDAKPTKPNLEQFINTVI
jgi:thiol-disulfide isomerase/thioredoxin